MRFLPILLALVAVSRVVAGEEHRLVFVDQGQPQVVIHAPGEHESAARRLVDRIERYSGAKVEIQRESMPPATPSLLLAIGTPESNPVVHELTSDDVSFHGLGDEGYRLRTIAWNGRTVLLAAGKTSAGVQHAVSELVSWKLRYGEGNVSAPDVLDEAESPALARRIVWTWDGHLNWAPTVDETMKLYVNGNPEVGSMAVPYTQDGFRQHMTRAIDYLSDHKLNGMIVWGYLRDEHGGLDMGREISRYGRAHHVRLLPGVCSQGGYGGFLYSREHRFNLDVWCKEHPELQARNAKGEPVAGMLCPSKPENQTWLREGAEWLFENLPDIGGVNLENGDFMSCQCEECQKRRDDPQNDPNCLWDMATTQRPILEVAQRVRPDAWMTFATYVGFSEASARNAGKRSVYPPRFLDQLPDNAVCQWTVTGMANSTAWPEGLKPPPGKLTDHIGMLHHGSLWGAPVDPGRWWAAPAAWGDEYSEVLPLVCSRLAGAGMTGLVVTEQNGDQCPAHELNYVAFEYFSWFPRRSMERFHAERLTHLYGDAERAEKFLGLLRDTTRAPTEITASRASALAEAESSDLDVRQRSRWRNLADELARRESIAVDRAAKDASP